MGYLIKVVLGGALFLGGIVLFNVKLVSLLETGTCASGNTPYQIARPCPAGTGTDILLLIASIFGGLIGAAIFAARGSPPWASGKRAAAGGMLGFGTFAWGLFFTATGATSLIASLTNQAIQDSAGGKLGGLIVGGTFLLMGVPALLISLWGMAGRLTGRRRDERPSMPAADPDAGMLGRMRTGVAQASGVQQLGSRMGWSSAGGGRGTGDVIGKLERLQKLKESGALSEAEFNREKARVLAEQ
jgi:hypothetical protein